MAGSMSPSRIQFFSGQHDGCSGGGGVDTHGGEEVRVEKKTNEINI